MALPSVDSVPIAYLVVSENNAPLPVPDVFQIWLTHLVDIINEAMLQIDRRLTAGGL